YRADESATIDAVGLPDLAQGQNYVAWLATTADANSQATNWIRLGVLTKQAQNQWTTTFNGSSGTNLLGLGNTVEILRQSASAQSSQTPTASDPVVLKATYP